MSQPAPAVDQVRRLTAADLDWVEYLTMRAYPDRVKDWDGFRRWYVLAVDHKDGLMIRTENAYKVSFIQHLFYDPAHPVVNGLFTASEFEVPWQIMALLNETLRWALSKGAEFKMGAMGNKDALPFMQRLAKEWGAELEIERTYTVRLNHA